MNQWTCRHQNKLASHKASTDLVENKNLSEGTASSPSVVAAPFYVENADFVQCTQIPLKYTKRASMRKKSQQTSLELPATTTSSSVGAWQWISLFLAPIVPRLSAAANKKTFQQPEFEPSSKTNQLQAQSEEHTCQHHAPGTRIRWKRRVVTKESKNTVHAHANTTSIRQYLKRSRKIIASTSQADHPPSSQTQDKYSYLWHFLCDRNPISPESYELDSIAPSALNMHSLKTAPSPVEQVFLRRLEENYSSYVKMKKSQWIQQQQKNELKICLTQLPATHNHHQETRRRSDVSTLCGGSVASNGSNNDVYGEGQNKTIENSDSNQGSTILQTVPSFDTPILGTPRHEKGSTTTILHQSSPSSKVASSGTDDTRCEPSLIRQSPQESLSALHEGNLATTNLPHSIVLTSSVEKRLPSN